MEDPIETKLGALAVTAPVTDKVLVEPEEPIVKVPVLANVVADPMVELLLAKPRFKLNAVEAVFMPLTLSEPEIVIPPV